MTILGISAYYHDSAAAIIRDGHIIAAVQEERFSRIKNDSSFPAQSIQYCLQQAGTSIDELDAVVYYEKPFLKFERLLETYYAFAPKGFLSFFKSIPAWVKDKIFIKQHIRKSLKHIQPFDSKKLNLCFTEHHFSHAASAFYPSGLGEAAIVTIDGVGEWATTTICKGSGNKIEILKELHFPHSIGLLYSAFTYYLGFKVNSDEYKLMGLAPYGNPASAQTKKFSALLREHLVTVFEDGSVQMNQSCFSYPYKLRMVNDSRFEKLLGFKRRLPDEPFSQEHLDCALAVQLLTEDIVLKICRHAAALTGSRNLCLAGGVALNCVANGKIQQEGIFDNLFIQPAAGDAGGALGAALAGYYILYEQERSLKPSVDDMQGAYLGPSFTNEEIDAALTDYKGYIKKFNSDDDLCAGVASLISKGNVIGWFQGRMEYGPRALGSRSILADPRNPEMQRTLNLKIKFRESFRPFAPIVMEEEAGKYFDIHTPSPYMLLVKKIRNTIALPLPDDFSSLTLQQKLGVTKSTLPAITHVDLSARIQTVTAGSNLLLYKLLASFRQLTGTGVLVNTSFNVKDEPIVCTPAEALKCFHETGMDVLVMGNYLLAKQPVAT